MPKIDAGSLDYMAHRAQTFRRLPRKLRRKHIRRERWKSYRDLPILYEVLVLLYGRRCAACGARYNLTIDHILPISRGGRTTFLNLQLLCEGCNKAKQSEIMDFREE